MKTQNTTVGKLTSDSHSNFREVKLGRLNPNHKKLHKTLFFKFFRNRDVRNAEKYTVLTVKKNTNTKHSLKKFSMSYISAIKDTYMIHHKTESLR